MFAICDIVRTKVYFIYDISILLLAGVTLGRTMNDQLQCFALGFLLYHPT